MYQFKLPQWKQLHKKVEANKELDTLEQFVYDYEPSEKEDAEKFRKNLKKLVDGLFYNGRA
jgi:hypothetical protein